MDRLARLQGRVVRACRTAHSPIDLLRSVKDAIARDIPCDRWCSLTLDPATTLATGGSHDEGVSPGRALRLMQLEFGGEDFNALRVLARARDPVSTLSLATGGNLEQSARFREALAPEGICHELRAVFRDSSGPWAALILLRGAGADFSAPEMRMLSAVSENVTQAMRRVLLLGEIEAREGRGADGHAGPALILLRGKNALELEHASADALEWLQQIDDSRAGEVPYALISAALHARRAGRAITRLCTRAGRWLTVHAEALDAAGRISLILQPSRPHEIAQILSCAYALTSRESEIARLVASGRSNVEIAATLSLSRYTVEDHLRNVFEKLGVRSRSELISRLFFDQYLPRSARSPGLDGDGWFLGPTRPRRGADDGP